MGVVVTLGCPPGGEVLDGLLGVGACKGLGIEHGTPRGPSSVPFPPLLRLPLYLDPLPTPNENEMEIEGTLATSYFWAAVLVLLSGVVMTSTKPSDFESCASVFWGEGKRKWVGVPRLIASRSGSISPPPPLPPNTNTPLGDAVVPFPTTRAMQRRTGRPPAPGSTKAPWCWPFSARAHTWPCL